MDIQQMRQWVKHIIETEKYNYMRRIKSNAAVYAEVTKCYGKTDKEKAYIFANPDQKTSCKHGGVYNFVSVTEGYAFCSKYSKCVCAQKAKGASFRATLQEKAYKNTSSIDAEFAAFYNAAADRTM